MLIKWGKAALLKSKYLFFEKIKVKIVKKMDKIKNLLKISLNSSNLKPLKRFKFDFLYDKVHINSQVKGQKHIIF